MIPTSSQRPWRLQGEPGYLRAGLLFIGGVLFTIMGIDDALHKTGPFIGRLPGLALGIGLLIGAASDVVITRKKRRRA